MRSATEAFSEIERLIQAYRQRGVFLDTNVLLLYVVGALGPQRLSDHDRTSGFTLGDFNALLRFCNLFPRIVTSPSVLTESSNLLGKAPDLRRALKALCIDVWDEVPSVSRAAAAVPAYPYVGLTDATIVKDIAGAYLVLTMDAGLLAAVMKADGGAIHFDWIRAAAGTL